MTTDVEAAKKFYAKLFGWAMEDMKMENMVYTTVKAGDSEIGGIMPIPEMAKGMPPMWSCYVTVSDVDATAKEAAQIGGKVIVPPQDIPDVGRFCVIQDPTGGTISAITYVKR